MKMKPLIMLGAGGHAKVLLSLVHALQLPLLGVCASDLAEQGISHWRGLNVLGHGDHLNSFKHDDVALINGIGQRADNNIRRIIFERFKSQGFYFPTLVHPNAWVDPSAILEEGVQVMAGAIIQADAFVGANTTINTQASVDHDCLIKEHVHLAPGSVLCGTVRVNQGCFIATGARVAPGVTIGECAIIGAGTSVVRDVKPYSKVLPAPIRTINPSVEIQLGEK